MNRVDLDGAIELRFRDYLVKTDRAIYDRSDATIELSREHSDFWVRNLLAILVEERLSLVTYRSDALLYGGLPFGS